MDTLQEPYLYEKLSERKSTVISAIITASRLRKRRVCATSRGIEEEEEHVYCPNCEGLLIRGWGFRLLENDMRKGKCTQCDTSVDGVGL